MEKKSANDILRKIIREEVTRVIRQELPKILSESTAKPTPIQKKSEFPLTLNSAPTPKFEDIKFSKSNNPLASLLNETARNMVIEGDLGNFTTSDVGPGMNPAMAFQPKEATVGNVNDMLSTARPSSNLEAVQINAVPDFSAMMDKMGL